MSGRRTSLVAAAVIALATLIGSSLRWHAAHVAGVVPDAPAPRSVDPEPDVLAPSTVDSIDRAPVTPVAASDAAIAPIDGIVYGNGAPLHDASILFGPVGTEPEAVRANYVYTDREGKFTIHPAHDVEHKLTISKDGWSTATANSKPGDHVSVNLESPRSMGGISGQVVDSATDQPVTDFTLDVSRKKRDGWQSVLSRHIQDSGGRFHEQLPIAESEIDISVQFTASDHRDTSVLREHVTRSAQVDLGKIPMEKIEGVRSGLVVDDRDGAPIANARVTPLSDKGIREDFVTTDEHGRFMIEHQRAKALSGFVAAADDFEPLYLPLASEANRTSTDGPILRMKQGVELRGKVIAGGPLPKDLQVGYWSDEVQDPYVSMPNAISKLVKPKDTGEYVLTHVPSRKVTVGILRIVSVKSVRFSQAHFEHLTTVDCSDGQGRTIDLKLGDGFDVQMTLVARGVRSNAGAFASLLGPDGSRLFAVDATVGSNVMFSDVPRGTYVLHVANMKERFFEVPLSVVDGAVNLGDVDISACFARR
jgi:hypothetical protein